MPNKSSLPQPSTAQFIAGAKVGSDDSLMTELTAVLIARLITLLIDVLL